MRYLVLVVALLAARPADACGVPDVGQMVAALVEAFDPKTEKIQTPLVSLGGGTSTDGRTGTLLIGYGWGDLDHGGMFPGSALTRVMAGVRRGDDTAVSLTYGWYETQIASMGFDFGIEHQVEAGGTGPIARLTIGGRGIAARFGGGYMVGGESRLVGQAEIVIELMDLVGRI